VIAEKIRVDWLLQTKRQVVIWKQVHSHHLLGIVFFLTRKVLSRQVVSLITAHGGSSLWHLSAQHHEATL
jgi:hypothetical protein